MKRKVGITYDLKTDWEIKEGVPSDMNAEFDPPETLESIIRALESEGNEVVRIGNAYNLLKKVEKLDVDIVFNIAEGYSGRNRESQAPVILEMFNIPYVGSDALTLGLTLDKVVAKRYFQAQGIPTPKYFQAQNISDLENMKDLSYPLIVKCTHEGSSKGLSKESKVGDFSSLLEQVEKINKIYKQPAIIEEFISGMEFTVAVLGNKNPQAMPVVQVSIDGTTQLGGEFYTFERISSDRLQYVCPAQIPEELTARMQELAVKVYTCVDCCDFGRVDFRVDQHGTPFVLEINPLPCLAENDIFNIFPQTMGSTYERTINQILEYGLQRYSLLDRSKSAPKKETFAR